MCLSCVPWRKLFALEDGEQVVPGHTLLTRGDTKASGVRFKSEASTHHLLSRHIERKCTPWHKPLRDASRTKFSSMCVEAEVDQCGEPITRHIRRQCAAWHTEDEAASKAGLTVVCFEGEGDPVHQPCQPLAHRMEDKYTPLCKVQEGDAGYSYRAEIQELADEDQSDVVSEHGSPHRFAGFYVALAVEESAEEVESDDDEEDKDSREDTHSTVGQESEKPNEQHPVARLEVRGIELENYCTEALDLILEEETVQVQRVPVLIQKDCKYVRGGYGGETKEDIFKVGDHVERRDRQNEQWGRGYVTSADPLRITVEDDASERLGYAWNEVRRIQDGEHRQTSSFLKAWCMCCAQPNRM